VTYSLTLRRGLSLGKCMTSLLRYFYSLFITSRREELLCSTLAKPGDQIINAERGSKSGKMHGFINNIFTFMAYKVFHYQFSGCAQLSQNKLTNHHSFSAERGHKTWKYMLLLIGYSMGDNGELITQHYLIITHYC
jgi:hypothetical protein